MHVDQQLSKGRALRSTSVCPVNGNRSRVPSCVLSIRRIDRVEERVDHSVFEILILKLLAKDKSLDEEIDLFSVASGVAHILRTEYAVSIQPLDV